MHSMFSSEYLNPALSVNPVKRNLRKGLFHFNSKNDKREAKISKIEEEKYAISKRRS